MSVSWMERRLRISGVLVGLGLLIEVLTMPWTHPIAFLMFMLVASPLTGAGVVMYLYSILKRPARR